MQRPSLKVRSMSRLKKPPKDLREAIVAESLKIVEKRGVEALSMREVARRLGVSHQAPYKHFESRDHILAEMISRAYDSFAAHLELKSRAPGVDDEMREMGLAYFEYAAKHPLQYRLMFSTPLPTLDDHPDMMRRAHRCYSLLLESIAKLPTTQAAENPAERTQRDALFVWSSIHGLASALQSDAIKTMDMSKETLANAIPHTLMRIGAAMAGELVDKAAAPTAAGGGASSGAVEIARKPRSNRPRKEGQPKRRTPEKVVRK